MRRITVMKDTPFVLWIAVFLFAVAPIKAAAPDEPETEKPFRVAMVKTDSSINIDGRLDEEAWDHAATLNHFIQYWPNDGGIPGADTEIRLLYDDEHIYIGAILRDINNHPIIQSLRRNIADEFFRSDAIGVILDPFNEQNNGFFFGVNAGNAQVDASLSVTDNTTEMDTNWNTRWYSATITEGPVLYIEIAIPFQSFQFSHKSPRWRINFIRNDMQRFEFNTWFHVPVPLPGYDLRYTGEITWDAPPGSSSTNIALLPYMAGDAIKNRQTNEPAEPEFSIGGGIRYALGPSFNLDVTLNPDFSNMEVDEHIINLSRFDVTLPEKRPFFLENSDIFTSFGRDEHRPFISRNIGLDQGQQIPILYGAKLSGSLSSGLRVGAMNVQTRQYDNSGAQNYSLVALQQQVLNRSQIRGLFVNRQADNLFSGEGDFNRLAGLEFTYTSSGGGLSAKAMYHLSFTQDHLNNNAFYGTDINYSSRHWKAGFNAMRINRNYITDIGFFPRQFHYDAARDTIVRRGFTKGAFWIAHTIIPKKRRYIAQHEPGVYTDHQYDDEGRLTDRISGIWYEFETLNGDKLQAYFDYFETNLQYETRLLGDSFIPLPATSYSYYRTGFRLESDTRRSLSGNLNMEAGSFFNGSQFIIESAVAFRASPRVRLGTGYTLNRVSLPEEYGETTLHLIGPRAYISFSNTLFWNTFMQYNTQAENFNINSRFQWRFMPMSDLFLVYNENADSRNLALKNRQITFKLTYWFNL